MNLNSVNCAAMNAASRKRMITDQHLTISQLSGMIHLMSSKPRYWAAQQTESHHLSSFCTAHKFTAVPTIVSHPVFQTHVNVILTSIHLSPPCVLLAPLIPTCLLWKPSQYLRVQITEINIMQFTQASCYFLPRFLQQYEIYIMLIQA
jgi:hypothetical protein